LPQFILVPTRGEVENSIVSWARKFQYLLGIGLIVLAALEANGESRERKTVSHRQGVVRAPRKSCSVRFGGSALPEPCDRLGEMPATAEPMHIIGKLPSRRDVR